MPELDVSLLTNKIVGAAFLLSILLGIVMRATHFCTLGAISDIALMGHWGRMRMWLVAIAVAILGTNLLGYMGFIDTSKSLYSGARLLWLSYLVGGVLFGMGMVFASGCGSKNLIRLGGGNLKSWVVFLAMGVASLATLHGVFALMRVASVDSIFIMLPVSQDLPSLLTNLFQNTQRAVWQLILACGFSGLFLIVGLWRGSLRDDWQRLSGGVIVGLVVVALWFLSGHLGYLSEDPNTLEEIFLATNSRRMEALSFVVPYGYTLDLLMRGSDVSQRVTLGIACLLGLPVGALIHAVVTRSFRWEGFRSVEDTALHLLGGVLMGVGGVMALGCTIGQGISGLSVLSVGAPIAVVAMVFGAFLGLHYQSR